MASGGRSSFRFRPLTGGVLGVAALLVCVTPLLSLAQHEPPTPNAQTTKAPHAATFVRLAHSSATVQARAAELAATRDTRAEAKAFVQRMVEFRREQIPRLEAAAREHKVPLPKQPELEHRVIVENLEPLDHLELTRRYAEFQVQALEQEIQIYGGAANAADEWMRVLAGETAPKLRTLLDQARSMRQASGP
ncbi:DUF4142 domain-containing protein [Methylobacterium sp. BE186]|uniref:DUF4142 domain-containing protein n=1 Tax=Methylobacterium sp. BE186 TaxID=2817715 RepID=UPI00386219BC